MSPICAPGVKLVVSRKSTAIYRVTRSFAASTWENGHFLTVRRGALLAVDGPLKQFGLMEAVCEERRLLVFTRDIQTCAECVVYPRAAETI